MIDHPFSFCVRPIGLEPTRRNHQILSLARLPIPPRALFVGAKVRIFYDLTKFSASYSFSAKAHKQRTGRGFTAVPRFKLKQPIKEIDFLFHSLSYEE